MDRSGSGRRAEPGWWTGVSSATPTTQHSSPTPSCAHAAKSTDASRRRLNVDCVELDLKNLLKTHGLQPYVVTRERKKIEMGQQMCRGNLKVAQQRFEISSADHGLHIPVKLCTQCFSRHQAFKTPSRPNGLTSSLPVPFASRSLESERLSERSPKAHGSSRYQE